MNIGTVARTALKAVRNESIDNKILVSKKIIKDFEQNPDEASFRLCRDLRSVLRAVTNDAGASADQISEAGSLLARVKTFDPRNQSDESEENDDRPKPKPAPPKAPDGFERGSIDPLAAIARVTAKYGQQQPPWTDLENEKLLQVALGETPLSDHSVQQLWLSLAYDFKERSGCVEGSLAPQTRWITAALCSYANRRSVALPTANCFSSVSEELAFRN